MRKGHRYTVAFFSKIKMFRITSSCVLFVDYQILCLKEINIKKTA